MCLCKFSCDFNLFKIYVFNISLSYESTLKPITYSVNVFNLSFADLTPTNPFHVSRQLNYTKKISFALISVLMHALPVGEDALASELARVAARGDRRSLVWWCR